MPVSSTSENLQLDTKRHSFAHLMACSVQIYFKELEMAENAKNQKLGISSNDSTNSQVQFGVGPVIENGCFYDFILPRPLLPEDLPKIEKIIQKLLKQDLRFERIEVTLEEAMEIFKKSNQPLKVELLENLRDKGTTSLSDEERADFESQAKNITALILEKSILPEFLEEVLQFANYKIAGENDDFGKFYEFKLENNQVENFADLIFKALNDGKFYAEVTSKVIFKNEIFDLQIEGDEQKAVQKGLSLGIPAEQLDFLNSKKYLGNSHLPTITFYRLINNKTGEVLFEDLCKGPHVGDVKELSKQEKVEKKLPFAVLSEKEKQELQEVNDYIYQQEYAKMIVLEKLKRNGIKSKELTTEEFSNIDANITDIDKLIEHKDIKNLTNLYTAYAILDATQFWSAYKPKVEISLIEIIKGVEQVVISFISTNPVNRVANNFASGFIHRRVMAYIQEKMFGIESENFAQLEIMIEPILQEQKREMFYEVKTLGTKYYDLGFTLDKFSASYWRGDQARGINMQRLYALVFETQEEMETFKTVREEAKKRDHRVLNETQKYYTISDLVGAGLPLFQPNGMWLRKNVQDYLWQLHKDKGYQQVWTPHIAKEDLYVCSGHAAKFGDELFRVQGKTDKFFMKPMNCPHHMQLFANNQFSYRDMPVRYFEHATVYRDEKPGQLSGFARVRSITQDDGHLFCRINQIKEEVSTIVGIIREFYTTIGMEPSWVSLSVRDMNDLGKYLGSNEAWDLAEKSLEMAAQMNDLNYKRVEGEAAFYGPKLDFMFKDALGREWQLATIQCDFNLPERFNLEFTNENGEKERPVVIHRAIGGSAERFLGVIIDHFGGRFPFWLAPVQLKILTINNQAETLEYVEKVKSILSEIVLMKPLKYNELRFEIDDRQESLGKKIREGEMAKIPVLLIVGPKDILENQVSVRTQEGESKVKLESLRGFLQQLN